MNINSLINIPKLDYGNLIPNIPNISNMTDLKVGRITSAIEQLQYDNLINEIEQLNYNIKLKETEKNNYQERLKNISSSIDITAGIWCSIIVAVISVLIPFMLVSFNNYLEKFKDFIFIYMIISFVMSMIILIGYLIYSYKSNKY